MKSTKWVALMAAVTIPLLSGYAQGPAGGAANISPNAAEVVKLASSGVGDDVVLAYVQNAQAPFDLTADNVLYLRDLGVSQPVITAMLNHDNAIRGQGPENAPTQYAPTPAQAGPAPGQAPEGPPPQATAAPGSYVSTPPPDVTYFYNDLAPYGTWVSLPSVGWCWQPSVVVVNRGWRPYCDAGQWVYTDDGWFWQSDYSWGWAPFHYGRWYLDARCGWVWLPGREWGPAWVTWRTVGTTCGWAPLPPGADFVAGMGWRWHGRGVGASFDFGLGVNAFAFVSFGNLCERNVAYHCLPQPQATVIFKQTTVVNNYTVVNHTYVNHGISVDRIKAARHTPIPRATVREGRPGSAKPSGASGAVVYRAPLKAPERPARMVAQKVDPVHPVIHHNTAATLGSERKPGTSAGEPGTAWQRTPNSQVKGQTTTPVGGTPSGSAGAGSTKPQAGRAQTHQWQAPEKPGANAQTFSAPATPQGQTGKPGASAGTFSAPKTPQSQVVNQENRSLSGSQPATGGNPYAQGAFSKSPSGVTAQSSKGAGPSYGSTGQGQAASGQPVRENTTSHFYNPKTVEQSSRVRSIYQQPKAVPTAPPSTGYPPGGKKNQ